METHQVKVQVADPTPLGLFGLALVTLVASSQKLGWTEGLSFVIPWALFLGGMAQIIASFFDFKHNNLFGATAFCAYGLFWVAVSTAWLMKMGILGETLAAAADGKQLGVAFIGYLLLSIPLTISTLKMSVVMFVLMADICLLFLSLGFDSLGLGESWHTVAAYSELTISLLTFYALSAKYLAVFFGKPMLPVGNALIK
ncbi:MAG: acetate uptake transporter [Flavobacteriaceae bacterium]|jgi:succinate-acetate transporter protein|nr:acetate uptake transporter [Flavobacteriaceae bacterium]